MRILFLSLAVPFPCTNGQRIRNGSIVKALAEEGHEVSLIAFAEPEDLGLKGLCLETCRTVTFVPVPAGGHSSQSYGRRLRALGSLRPYGAVRFDSPVFADAIRERLALDRFDVILCDDVYAFSNIPSPGPPVVLNKHDITHIILGRFLRYERNPIKRLYGWLEYWKIRRWESLVCSRVPAVLACSENDRQLLKALAPGTHMAVAPNVIDTDAYTPRRGEDSRTVLYVGAMDWYPNRDAVDLFVSKMMPLLRRQGLGVRFVVAGRAPSEAFRKKFHNCPDVEFTGTVPDMAAEIAKAAVCVVPLRIGSGTRLKILEAAAMGKAIVSTRVGAVGLEFENMKEILLADDPQSFAHAVATLLASGSLRRAMGRAARRRVEACYSMPVLRASLRAGLAPFVTKVPVAARRPFHRIPECEVRP